MDATVARSSKHTISASVALWSLRAEREWERERDSKQTGYVFLNLHARRDYRQRLLHATCSRTHMQSISTHSRAHTHKLTQASNNNSLIGCQRPACAMAAILIMLNVSKWNEQVRVVVCVRACVYIHMYVFCNCIGLHGTLSSCHLASNFFASCLARMLKFPLN